MDETRPPAESVCRDRLNVRHGCWQRALAASSLGLGLALVPVTVAQLSQRESSPDKLDRFVVTATRTPQPPKNVAATADIYVGSDLELAPTMTLDDALRAEPNFTLFRRNDSLTANPTTQGVSLRGLGPNGASRSLVLLDGVPLNDPFGGWIAWSKIPRDAIGRVEIIPGGGASAWGNAALGGVIQLFTLPARLQMTVVDEPSAPIRTTMHGTAQFSAWAGDFGTRNASIDVVRPLATGALQILGEDFTTDGVLLIAPENRGSIDVPAWSRHRTLMARWHGPIGTGAEITATFRSFEEFRGNGTPYQRNGSREKFASVQAAGQPHEGFAWSASGYVQDESYASTFSSVNVTRSAETPASDQFAVPATAFGASATGVWDHPTGGSTAVGADVRLVNGETRENFNFTNGAFTRQRVAGGAQTVGGVFLTHEQPWTKSLRLSGGLRLDEWSDENGHRRELDLASGALARNDRYADRQGTEFSPSAGFVWTPAKSWRVHGNAQQAFRQPTLNELYRPFRQGSNIVEANAGLKIEHVTSAEVGIEWAPWRPTAAPARGPPFDLRSSETAPLLLGATVFWNDLRDAVSNVTVARGPGTFPLFGSLPSGGIGRQRLNLDRTQVEGAEFSATWHASRVLSVTARYLANAATVREARVAPNLIGNQLAEVPRQSASIGATLQAPGQFTLSARVRWIGRQWDDDENTLRLGEAVVADIGMSRPLTKHLDLFLNIENVGNTRVETARSANGVFNIGTPRFAFGGIRGRW